MMKSVPNAVVEGRVYDQNPLPFRLVAGTIFTKKSGAELAAELSPESPHDIKALYHQRVDKEGAQMLMVVFNCEQGTEPLIALKVLSDSPHYPRGTFVGHYWSELEIHYDRRAVRSAPEPN